LFLPLLQEFALLTVWLLPKLSAEVPPVHARQVTRINKELLPDQKADDKNEKSIIKVIAIQTYIRVL
jgi:hypothetical protein